MISKMRNIKYLFLLPSIIIYFETVLKVSVYEEVMNEGYIFMCLFSIPAGIAFYLLTSGFKEKTNKILFISILSLLTIYYGGQMLYYKIFSTFASLYFFIGAKKAAQFAFILYDTIGNNLIPLFFIMLPLTAAVILFKKINFIKIPKESIYKIAFSAAVLQASVVFLVASSDDGMLSPSYLYTEVFIIQDSVDKFGLLTTGRLDIKNILKNIDVYADEDIPMEIVESEDITDNDMHDVIETEEPADENEIAYGYNKLNIPFDELIKNEHRSSIADMHKYFMNIKPTKKNKYTGMFKDKNLILITAEGFSPYAIDKDITPTLYMMQEGGFKFTDFYTPLWGVSTSDGEYVACTSLLPKEGVWSFYKSAKNYMPFSMGNQLKSAGYNTYAYHNHYYDYYFRNESHPNMGYIYKGLGNGLDVTETWPESDIEMIELSVPEFINNQPFHAYYMTVSGHLQYSFTGNYIAAKNRSLVEHLDYSEHVKAYLACNIELDRAMEIFIAKLEEAGIAEDTLIAISPDHYPYGLTKQELSELAGKEIKSDFDIYKGVFLLWSKGMEPVEINKVSSSLDIIPTISNLMGLDYDSRLLMGRDILSDAEPLVVFEDRSFVTDKIIFEAKTERVTNKEGFNVDSVYINEKINEVKQKFKYSSLVLDNNYYKAVFNK
ncbi:sulfatase-like hydrolase/transferase [Sedimentibacter sp.]|uniref:LTA synthase family protein n=1 Tax=Sedimentibacter sp. TaxID=1960295 RepID=UPI002898D316|nr:sulfatase-like hydrolase/transferase [Sedimentibacter sp.]